MKLERVTHSDEVEDVTLVALKDLLSYFVIKKAKKCTVPVKRHFQLVVLHIL